MYLQNTYIRTDDSRLARAEGDRSCLLNSRPAVSAKKKGHFFIIYWQAAELLANPLGLELLEL